MVTAECVGNGDGMRKRINSREMDCSQLFLRNCYNGRGDRFGHSLVASKSSIPRYEPDPLHLEYNL